MRRIRLHVLLPALLLGVFIAQEVSANETVSGTRFGDAMAEVDHRVEVTVDRGFATLVVRRTLHNGGAKHDQAELFMRIPEASVATGLRTLGELHGRPHWFDGELYEAEDAAERYAELTGLGGYTPKDPALLSWRSRDELALQVFPVAPHSDKTVEYTLTLPTVYEDGRHRVELTGMGTETMPAKFRVSSARPRDQLFVDDVPSGNDRQLALGVEGSTELSISEFHQKPVSLELAVARASLDAYVTRYQIAAAPEISQIPRGTRLVLLIDASRSLSDAEVDAQLDAARHVLSHFAAPRLDARAELMFYDREARGVAGGLVPVPDLLAAIDAAPIVRRNGSEIGRAIASATRVLARAPAGRERRIVLLSDYRTRSELTPRAAVATARRSGATLHLAEVAGWDADDDVTRDDDHDWAAVAAVTGGVVWQLRTEAEARPSYEELARPLRVDALEVVLEGAGDEIELDVPDTLDEGSGVEHLDLHRRAAGRLVVNGKLWNRRFHAATRPDSNATSRWSAMVFGDELSDMLDETQMLALARAGRAVSPVTSYLAIEPGVRPSTAGFEGGLGLIGTGRGGGGSGEGSIGLGTTGLVGRGSPPPDKLAWLQAAVADAARRCGSQRGAVGLETTSEEIVSVSLEGVPRRGTSCFRSALWAVELPYFFDDRQRQWRIQLP